jgi:type IV pili sensor histidine kinase/response regulator
MPRLTFIKTAPFWVLSISTFLLYGCAKTIHPRYGQTTDRWPPATNHTSIPSHPPALDAIAHKSGQHWLQVGRYHSVNAIPSKEQQALLQVIIEVTLPEEVGDIQAAVDYLLLRSGYQFTVLPQSLDVQQLLQKPIPAVHRHLGPMTLESALQTLAGNPFQLTVDPVHRQVGYALPANITKQVFHEFR